MKYLGYIGLFLAASLVVSIAAGKWLKYVNAAYEREVTRHPDRVAAKRAKGRAA